MDYYSLLGITRNADDLQIKKAFKRLALQFNKSLQEDESVQELFVTVAEAYDVLSHSQTRAVYDQYGEAGLKKGVPAPNDYIQPYVYHGDYMRTYEEFYGTKSPYADLLDAYINLLPLYELPEGKGIKVKQEPMIRPVYLDLEEVYQGGVKKMKIMRQELISEGSGETELREKVLDVPIKPGLLEGTTIMFPEEGDQGPTMTPADIIFKVTDKPHPRFVRNGINLIMKVHVTLQEALTGTTVMIKTLDSRTLRIPIHDIINFNYEKIVANEGMPKVEDPNQKGDLIIQFQIDFPTYLPRASKNLIKKALSIARMSSLQREPENINMLIMADKMRRISKEERLPQM